MALAALRVPTEFTAKDRFSSVINTMTKSTRGFASGMSRLDNRINNSFNSMNQFSQLAVGAGIGALFYKAGQDIIDYEVKINSLSAVTGTAVGAMTQQIESLGKKTSRSVIDIAGSFEIVGSKMSEYLDNPEALKKITGASILMAEAARMELEPAISSLTGVMNIYKKSADDAYKIVNKLSAGETVGSVSIAQTTDILPQFGAQALRANVSIEESIALIQTLTKSLGVEGTGRGLRNILFDISSTKTWDKNRWKAIKMAGVDFEFVTNNANNLVDRLRELKKLQGTKGATELFFKRVNSIAANTLFQNFDRGEASFVSFLDKIITLDDAVLKSNKNNATFATLWARTKDSFTNYIVTQNEANTGLNIMKGLLGWLKDNMGLVITSVVSLGVAFLGLKVLIGANSLINGTGKAIRWLSLAIKEYRMIQLAGAISGRGFFQTIMAGTIPIIGLVPPLLIATAAIGGIAYMMKKTSETTKNFADSKNTSFNIISSGYETMEQRIVRSNERIVANMKKFKMDLESVKSTGKTISELRSERSARQISKFNSNEFIENTKKSSSALKTMPNRLIIPRIITDTDQAFNDIMNDGKSKNLAGNRMESLVTDISKKINKQQVEVIIKDPGNNAESVKVNGKPYTGGIAAKTDSTTGVKNKNAYGF